MMKIDDGKAGRWRVWMTGLEWGEVRDAAKAVIGSLRQQQPEVASEVARLTLSDLVGVLANRGTGSSPRQNAVVFDVGLVQAIPVVLHHAGRAQTAKRLEQAIEKWEAQR